MEPLQWSEQKKVSDSGGDSGSNSGNDGGDSGGSSDKGSGSSGNDDGSSKGDENGDPGPKGPSKEDTKDLTSDDPNVEPPLKPGDPACDTPDCKVNQPIPVKPTPIDIPGHPPIPCPAASMCVHPPCPAASMCLPPCHVHLFHDCDHDRRHHHHTVVVHQTKVEDAIHTTTTVFVPNVGLVQPFNCNLDGNTGKIGCDFSVVKMLG